MPVRWEHITSRSNPRVKAAAALLDKKARDERCEFTAEGWKLLEEALRSGCRILSVFVNEEKADRYIPLIEDLFSDIKAGQTTFFVLSAPCFEKITSEKASDGVVALIKHLDNFKSFNIIYKEDFQDACFDRLLILSSVRDPGNLGTVLRSALAFGIRSVLLSRDCADPLHPRALRAAMGSTFRLQLRMTSGLDQAIRLLRAGGRRVLAAELRPQALSVYEWKVAPSDVFVIGNEGHGIPPELSGACDGSVYIPIATESESLNAATAAAVLMWEAQRCIPDHAGK